MKIVDHHIASFEPSQLRIGDVIRVEEGDKLLGYYLFVAFDMGDRYALVRLSHSTNTNTGFVTKSAGTISSLLHETFCYPSSKDIRISIMKDAELHIGGI